MSLKDYAWDIFIAHAGDDEQAARELYSYLRPQATVFLASQNLELGDNWARRLATEQRRSLITAVLISSKTAAAYYQQEEIAAAIALARDGDGRHRVIPIYLDRTCEAENYFPYGLRSLQSITISNEISLRSVADRMLSLLSRFPIQVRPTPSEGRGPVAEGFTTDIPKLAGVLALTIIECIKSVGDTTFSERGGMALAEREARLADEIFPLIRSLIQKGPSEETLGSLLEQLLRDFVITADNHRLLEKHLESILSDDPSLAWQFELLRPKLDELRAQLWSKRIETETALQKAESYLLETLYAEALACIEPLGDDFSLDGYKMLLKAIALLEGRFFNNLSNTELANIEQNLMSSSKRSKTSSLPFVLLAVLEIDYYRTHGRRGRSGITPRSLQESLSAHPLSDKERILLGLIRISERAGKALNLSTLSPE